MRSKALQESLLNSFDLLPAGEETEDPTCNQQRLKVTHDREVICTPPGSSGWHGGRELSNCLKSMPDPLIRQGREGGCEAERPPLTWLSVGIDLQNEVSDQLKVKDALLV